MTNLIDRFYSDLLDLRERIGGYRLLSKCTGSMKWPKKGVYFFFEPDETRDFSEDLRIVRVGTHAVSMGSRTALWDRLRTHRGSLSGMYADGGNHRGSIFRLHVGSAILNKGELKGECSSWGLGSSSSRRTRVSEHPIEMKVSQHIRSMPFLWLKVGDEPSPNSERAYLERNAISLLSNYNKLGTSEAIDPPSDNWLGYHCENKFVRESGLWNVDHVMGKTVNINFLNTLESRIEEM